MAPKKSLIILFAVILLTGLATAQNSADVFESDLPDPVWNNSNEDYKFELTSEDYDLDGDIDWLNQKGTTVNFVKENITDGELGKSSFNITNSSEFSEDFSLNISELEFEENGLTYSEGFLLPGDEFKADITLNAKGLNREVEPSNFEWDSNLEEDFDSGDLSQRISSRDISDSGEKLNFELSAQNFNGVSKSVDLTVYAFEASSDDLSFFYREMLGNEFQINAFEGSESFNNIEEKDFSFSNDEASNWLEIDASGNTVNFEFEARPDLNQGEDEIVVVEFRDREIADFEVVYRNRFAGEVRDLAPSRVDTQFYLEGPNTEFSTDQNGEFERFFTESTAEQMAYDFPNALVEMSNFHFKFEDPRGQTNDIYYEYYSEFDEIELGQKPDGLRPVNLAAFRSDYNFDQEKSRVYIDFDGSKVNSVDDVEVWECEYWMFERERCADGWTQKDPREDGQNRVSVSVNPYNKLFGGNVNVLWNAYLVGVPEGVGSSLAFESRPDLGSSRMVSGEEFSISGEIIDDNTGNSVEDVEVQISLNSESESFSMSAETGEDGVFEANQEIEESGIYDIEIVGEKPPFEDLVFEESGVLEVYYETGLSVTSESDPEIGLGEDYDIVYTVENTGQAVAEDIELDVSGVDDYSLEPNQISDLESGESVDIVLTINLPEDTRTPPSITFEVNGVSSGDEITGSASTLASFHDDVTFEEESAGSSEDTGDSSETESSRSYPDTAEVRQMTGEFIESQSQMNLALGLILVFAAVLAVAVKNKKNDSGRDMRGRGQSRVQAPQVAPPEEDEEEPEKEESAGSSEESENSSSKEEEESSSDTGEDGEVACDVCGETFDTESGMNLHKQALH